MSHVQPSTLALFGRRKTELLTVVIPTRNRSRFVGSLLRFIRTNGMKCRIIVADSSDSLEARDVDRAARLIAEVHHFPEEMPPTPKFLAAVKLVRTKYTVMLPDDDVTLPHAILAAVNFLEANADHVAAHGYVIDFGIVQNTFDMTGVRWFVPGVGDDGPIARIYNLIRRYQPFMWAVFRSETLISALAAAVACDRVVFQEMTTMVASVIDGKTARLPHIFCLRGMEESQSELQLTNPFYGVVTDSVAFFDDYKAYCDNLVALVRARQPETELLDRLDYFILPRGSTNGVLGANVTLEHALNLIHVLQFSHALDLGMINYTIQRMTGSGTPPIPVPPQWNETSGPLEPGDVEHRSGTRDRRYVWRRKVFEAEPRNEITITDGEVAIVERQLEHYDFQPKAPSATDA